MTAVFVEEGPDKGAIWHFGEPNKEQKALLEGKAWADLSHLAVIEVSGEDRLKWLHDLTTQYLVDFGVGIWTSAWFLIRKDMLNINSHLSMTATLHI
jgi:tRNA-modifying protein YgfZ